MKVLVYQAHPGAPHSEANKAMDVATDAVEGIEFVDLYATYPRFDIDVEVEQARLLRSDAILFQYPLFWYSTPSIIKEWQDLVLEHGFAYGSGGDKLTGKIWSMGITCGAPEEAYGAEGYNGFALRTLLTPMEQTARLCHMTFLPPYVLYGALAKREAHGLSPHAEGWRRWLIALRDDQVDLTKAGACDVIQAEDLNEVIR
ncbi:NAD(P)H-dependent oxidoreductase [Shimia sp. R10_1]|uniref:NAD(P)H-dependent oxidoreductase n=1 Tax=Shimia sp. R10_1 TaxID=2821095 RepID=UPI001AD9E93C|nr:NAD(P)H-dependent oxidoreductase [Shimia sp. R10_1]MBO9474340.1 NAD(P)H-dependent oxidoreductase [Shimia sp. R10_1]